VQPGLFNIFASAILRACKAPSGSYSSNQLNEVVGLLPQPLDTLRIMNYTVTDAPILFHDVGFQHIGPFLIELMNNGEPLLPVFLIAPDMVQHMFDDPHYRTLEAYFLSNDLGITINVTSGIYEVRGERVQVSDIRPRFLKGLAWGG